MGLLQAGYRTYESQAHRAGVLVEGEKEPLTPVCHMVTNAKLEVTLSDAGTFLSAREVPKEDTKTIIPATVESASRTIAPCAHPLCDNLSYIAPYDKTKNELYLTQLEQWAVSPFSHPKIRAILTYVQSGVILRDLVSAGILPDEPVDDQMMKYEKYSVRWNVIPAPEGTPAACWQDLTLFQSFADYYLAELQSKQKSLCMLTGKNEIITEAHPKGVVPYLGNAKLISANDTVGFTYRGRFENALQAESISYVASQKAHNGLRWVCANQGILAGGRMFICWNPEGIPVPGFAILGKRSDSHPKDFVSYRKELQQTLGGYGQKLRPENNVVICALDAATPGRLSVTYYNELKGSDFLARLESWYSGFCWNTGRYGIQSPSLYKVATYAFGTERNKLMEADDRVLREHIQQLLHCVVDRQPIPADILQSLVMRAGMPQAYSENNREELLFITCAAVRKYRNDRAKKEEWGLSLDTSNENRSYLFGRLLAIAEQVERSAYDSAEGRETNAIRLQSVFVQRPMYTWGIILDRLNPYFSRMAPGLRYYFKDMIGEISSHLSPDAPDLNYKLDDTYILGYYHQRSALRHKKEMTTAEENENEQSEE